MSAVTLPPHTPQGVPTKRELPVGVRCVRRNVSFAVSDLKYLNRRIAEAKQRGEKGATRSGQMRRIFREARAVRHDAPSEANGFLLIAQLMERRIVSLDEAAKMVREKAEGLLAMAEHAGDRPPLYEPTV